MGITHVLQQRMTPSTADPAQQKMMMFMPLMFTSMFLWAPSGLVLYWTTSNLWAIGQQALTNRLIGPPAQRTVAAAGRAPREERRRRQDRAGGEGAEVMELQDRVRRVSRADARRDGRAARRRDRRRRPTASASNLTGEDGELLLRRRGEALEALQHIVNTAFRRELERRSLVRRRLHRTTARARTPSCSRWRGS